MEVLTSSAGACGSLLRRASRSCSRTLHKFSNLRLYMTNVLGHSVPDTTKGTQGPGNVSVESTFVTYRILKSQCYYIFLLPPPPPPRHVTPRGLRSDALCITRAFCISSQSQKVTGSQVARQHRGCGRGWQTQPSWLFKFCANIWTQLRAGLGTG